MVIANQEVVLLATVAAQLILDFGLAVRRKWLALPRSSLRGHGATEGRLVMVVRYRRLLTAELICSRANILASLRQLKLPHEEVNVGPRALHDDLQLRVDQRQRQGLLSVVLADPLLLDEAVLLLVDFMFPAASSLLQVFDGLLALDRRARLTQVLLEVGIGLISRQLVCLDSSPATEVLWLVRRALRHAQSGWQ